LATHTLTHLQLMTFIQLLLTNFQKVFTKKTAHEEKKENPFSMPKFFIRNIHIKGNKLFSEATLKSKLGFEKDKMYSFEEIYQHIWMNPKGEDIASLYMDNGYLFFDVALDYQEIDSQTLDLKLLVSEGDVYQIDKISVRGKKYREEDLMRYIPMKRGERFSRLKVQQAYNNLSSNINNGIRFSEGIRITPKPNRATLTVDVEIEVE